MRPPDARPLLHLWAPRLLEFGGGIGACSRELARALQASGWRVNGFGRDDHAGRDAQTGVQVRGAGRAPGPLRKALFVALVSWAALRERPRLLVSTHLNFGPVAWLLSRVLGLRFVVLAHGVEVAPSLGRMRRHALRAAHAVWAVSRWTRGRLLELGVSATRIAVIGNTVDDGAFDAAAKPAAAGRARRLLTVARLDARERYKGCDQVIAAVARLRARGVEVDYTIVGDGDDAPRLRALADSSGIGGAVRLAGQLDDQALARAYLEADVYVMPSRGEGFGIVFLEAMASGTPVVGGNADGTADALDDGRLGRLVDPADVDALAGTLHALLAGEGPDAWFDPPRLRAACLARHGRAAFAGRVGAAARDAGQVR